MAKQTFTESVRKSAFMGKPNAAFRAYFKRLMANEAARKAWSAQLAAMSEEQRRVWFAALSPTMMTVWMLSQLEVT